MRAIQVSRFGGPDVLEPAELPEPVPGDGQVLVAVDGAGVNYADTHAAENTYLTPQTLPFVPGIEVVGRVEGSERRVVALLDGRGGYAEQAVADTALAFPVPDDVSDGAALALVLQGTTAWHLLRSCARLSLGDTVVVHAAAGGVGSLAVQLAKQWGAGRVIATASSQAKRDLALSLGADVAVDVSAAPDAAAVTQLLREANGGRPVDVVLEMTGGPVFDGSLAALGRFGRIVGYGMASRVPPSPVDPGRLMARSQTVTGFWLVDVLTRPHGLGPAMEELVSLVRAGRLSPVVGGTYPLAQARQAHEDLLARRTTGKLVLQP